MTMVSKTALGIAAGIFGTLFVGYCVYFDRQRRKDPNFKKKLRERRQANKVKCAATKETIKLPDVRDHKATQSFFFHQVEMGEYLLSQGDIEGAVEHIGTAVTFCGEPNQLLQVLQQTLPPHVFHLLLQRLPELTQRVLDHTAGSCGGGGGGGNLVEDDVE